MFNKTISKQLTQIMQMCYQINNVETNREETGNLPTVFVGFSGHTCQLHARIYEEGWGVEVDPDYTATIYLDYSDASEKLHVLIERLGVTLKLKARKEKKSEMCDYCGTYPHHNMCPNAEPRRVVGCCSVCHGEILEGDEIYQVADDEAIHADCVQGFTPEEVFTLCEIDPSQTFRNSDIEGSVFLELFGIKKECAYG